MNKYISETCKVMYAINVSFTYVLHALKKMNKITNYNLNLMKLIPKMKTMIPVKDHVHINIAGKLLIF